MHQSSSLLRIVLTRLTLCLACVFSVGSPWAHAQNNTPRKMIAEGLSKDAVFWAWKGNAGFQQCGYCHYQPGNEFAARESELSRFNELKVWLEKDKHAIARQRVEPIRAEQQAAALARFRTQITADAQRQVTIPEYWLGPSNALSARICEQLGQDTNTAAGYQWFRESCLTCHGGYDVKNKLERKHGESDKSDVAFDAQDVNHPGISCNYCHQADRGNVEWIDLHSGLTTTTKWRGMTPAQKTAAGMRDLTPVKEQAQLCFECHVGNLDKGMFVTHAMYAAGHPPLPAVELRTLTEEMPRHWQSPRELIQNGFSQSTAAVHYFQANYGVSGDAEQLRTLPWEAQAIAVGGLVAEQRWLETLVQAESSQHWGDYALYDCSACHHELLIDSPRQNVRSPGRPGRPRLTEWPHVGALAVAASLDDKSIQATFEQLQAAVKKRAFGDRQAVVQASQTMLKQINVSLEQLSLSRLPVDYNSRLLVSVCEPSAESMLDYQSARWINWSARGLMQPTVQPTMQRQIQLLGQALGPDGGERIMVTSKLPATQREMIYPDFVQRELERQQAYDSAAFLKQLQEIRQTASFNP